MPMKNEATGIARLFAATKFSMQGLRQAYRSEAAFRQEVWLCVVLVPAAFFVADTSLERALLIASLFLLMIVEVLNTAIEKVVDRIGDEYHELSGAAKDLGSAAVFLCLVLVAVLWIGVLMS